MSRATSRTGTPYPDLSPKDELEEDESIESWPALLGRYDDRVSSGEESDDEAEPLPRFANRGSPSNRRNQDDSDSSSSDDELPPLQVSGGSAQTVSPVEGQGIRQVAAVDWGEV